MTRNAQRGVSCSTFGFKTADMLIRKSIDVSESDI